MNDIEAVGLGKRYGRLWALRDCTLAIPAGRVVALVGPNGAGKTTLLHLAVGLATPTTGTITVCNGVAAGSEAALDRIAFVAQDAPLYRDLSVSDTLHVGRMLNRTWDQQRALKRLSDLGVPTGKKVGRLSGGQQSQLALTLALARRPALLILDEPLSRLDPLARHDFLALLMSAVSEDGLAVIFSSHVIPELERIADYLVVLAAARIQVAGDVDELLSSHRVLIGPTSEADAVAGRVSSIQTVRSERTTQILTHHCDAAAELPYGWESHQANMEELVLAYLRAPVMTETHATDILT